MWAVNQDVRLWTESFGDKDNPSVLLIVGAGAVSTFYSDYFCKKIVDAGLHVIRYDQRDYGASTHFTQIDPQDIADIERLKKTLPYRLEDLVSDALHVLDAYEISKAHIVGHSMGGIIAQLITATHPERLLSFTSMSCAPASHRFSLEPMSEEVLNALLANNPVGSLQKDIDGWLTSLKLLSTSFDPTLAKAYVQEIYKRDPHPGIAWNHIGIQHLIPDFYEEFQKNSIPGLILHGEEDNLQPVSYAGAVHNMIANTKLVTLSNTGHMFFDRKTEDRIVQALLNHVGVNT